MKQSLGKTQKQPVGRTTRCCQQWIPRSPLLLTQLPPAPQRNRDLPAAPSLFQYQLWASSSSLGPSPVPSPGRSLLLSYPLVLGSSGSRRRLSRWTCASWVCRKSIHMLQHSLRFQSRSSFCIRVEAQLRRLFKVQDPPPTGKCRMGRSQVQVFHQHAAKQNLHKNIPDLWCHLPTFENYSHFMTFELCLSS